MRELDVILVKYLEESYPSINKEEQQAFQALLELEDPQLFSLLLGNENNSDPVKQMIIKQLRCQFKI